MRVADSRHRYARVHSVMLECTAEHHQHIEQLRQAFLPWAATCKARGDVFDRQRHGGREEDRRYCAHLSERVPGPGQGFGIGVGFLLRFICTGIDFRLLRSQVRLRIPDVRPQPAHQTARFLNCSKDLFDAFLLLQSNGHNPKT